jgi:hypothetical protein
MELYDIDAFQGVNGGYFDYFPSKLGKLEFVDHEGHEIKFRPYLQDLFQKQLHKKKESVTLDNNINSLRNLDSILADIKRSNCYKCALVRFPAGDVSKVQVRLQRKSYYFLSITQNFNAEGKMTMVYNGGLRNICGMLDTFNFNYEKSLQKDKLGNMDFNWSVPIYFKRSSLDLQLHKGSSAIEDKIVEDKLSASAKLSFPWRDSSLRYSIEDRKNLFDPDDVSPTILRDDILPSWIQRFEFKCNLTASREHTSSLKLSQVFGESHYGALEVDSSYKLQLNKWLPSALPDKFRNITVQNIFGGRMVLNEHGPLRINDLYHLSQIRGFSKIGRRESAENAGKHPRHATDGYRHLGDHKGARLAIRNTTKAVFDSYPVLKESNMLRTFLHFTSVITSENKLRVDWNTDARFSAGLGLEIAYGPANIELLYNLWHSKGNHDARNFFQVKFAFGD